MASKDTYIHKVCGGIGRKLKRQGCAVQEEMRGDYCGRCGLPVTFLLGCISLHLEICPADHKRGLAIAERRVLGSGERRMMTAMSSKSKPGWFVL